MRDTKFGLMIYPAKPWYNVGDYIQSLAAEQFLPRVDHYVQREKLAGYNEEPIKMILNGWFMHKPVSWPPSSRIHPLLVSFHLNSAVADKVLHHEGVSWFKKYAPVGCRDPYSLEQMRRAGIGAYLSGCLTTTFKNNGLPRTDEIIFTDVLLNVPAWRSISATPRSLLKGIWQGDIWHIAKRSRVMEKIFSRELAVRATPLQHYLPASHTEQQRFYMARAFLHRYATARLVVTSRLHCALPCLAFGTPVIFIHHATLKPYDRCRLDGVTDLFNTVFIDEHDNITANFDLPGGKITEHLEVVNPDRFHPFSEELRERCHAFIHEGGNLP